VTSDRTIVDVGLTTYATDESMPIGELAVAAEQCGFESLFLPEHTHIPVARGTPYPGGGELPSYYARNLDPFLALTAAAALTSRLRLGTAVCLVGQRDPIVLAKEVATLDHLSGGRFLFGVGGGWNEEELRNHGTDPRTRWRLLRERIEAMRAIWSQDEAAYQGELVAFAPLWSWPKPVQRPGPPVLVGGAGPRVLDRVIAYGDGWIPPMGWIDDLAGAVRRLRGLEAEHGRRRIPVTVVGVKPRRAVVDELAALGVERVLIALPPAPTEVVQPLIERYASELL